MAKPLFELVDYLDSLLETSSYIDPSFKNGLQVNSLNENINIVAAAVDCGESIIDKAIEAKADLLIVHHGLITDESFTITETYGRKIAKLIKAGCSLYVSHLPLDGNLELGNAAEIARLANFTNIEPFFEFKGKTIGVKCNTETGPLSFNEVSKTITKVCKLPLGQSPLELKFGKEKINSIGILTGSGSSAIEECAKAGLDLLITGEAKQSAYHRAKEAKQNVIFAGHYATETFGVQAVLNNLAKEFKISTVFIDEPTGI